MQESPNRDYSFYDLFTPLSSRKAVIFIIITGILVYFNMLFNYFAWDDISFILKNPDMHPPNLIYLFSNNSFNSSGYYRPIPALYFTMLYNLFGQQAFFYHLFQLTLHLINSILLFYFLKRYTKNVYALLAVLLFVVHPLQVESVSYIAASQSELVFFFGFTGFLIGIKEKINIKQIVLMSVLLFLSILTKETGILFYFMVIVFKFIFNKKHIIPAILSMAISSILYCIIRFILVGDSLGKLPIVPIAQLTLFDRILNIPAILFYYIHALIYPSNIAIDQQWVVRNIDLTHFYFPLVIDVLFFALLIYGYKLIHTSKRISQIYIFFMIWLVLSMMMIVQIFPLDMTVSDRWMYLPLVGLCGLICMLMSAISKYNSKTKKVFFVFYITLILSYSIRTIIRNNDWQNTISIMTHDEKISNTSFDLENGLGIQYLDLGELNLAEPHFLKSVQFAPNYWGNWTNLGVYYLDTGQIDLADNAFSRAIKNNPNYYQAYQDLALLYYNYKGLQKTKEFIDTVYLPRFTQVAFAWYIASVVDYKLGNYHESTIEIQKAYSITHNPSFLKLYTQMQNRE